MKVELDGMFYGPDLAMYHPGVREMPDDWEGILPTGAKRVADDTPVTDDDAVEPTQPQSLRDLQRLTAQEGQELRKQNTNLKSQLTKQQNRLDKMLEQLKKKGIELDG